MERLPVSRVTIATRDVAIQSADLVIAATREAGLDPAKAANNPMYVSLMKSWAKLHITGDTFVRACRNLGILNPGLR